MGVVGSLPSLPCAAPSTLSNTVNTCPAESTSSADHSTCSSTITMDETDSSTNSSSNPSDGQSRKYSRRRKSASSLTVMYGPINIKVRQSTAPTLATGRCSKFVPLQGEAAVKREIRRKRNRDAAKKLKEKRATIEDDLNQQVRDCETKEKELLLTIASLKAYKEHLESECQHLALIQERIAQSTFKKVEQKRQHLSRSVPRHDETVRIKEEPRPSSPQWQLLFSI